MGTNRVIIESPLYQGEDEKIIYTLDTTPWGNNPSDIVVTIYDKNRIDYSSTCLSGSASANGNIITTPKVQNLTAGKQYQFEIRFTISTNVLEAFAIIHAEH